MALILVVDDHEEERFHLWKLLKDAGHSLIFAGDGQTGLNLWEKRDPDVIVTELYLPELNGLRLIKEVMTADPGARILAYSEISRDQLLMAEDMGACCVLPKPVDPEKFMEGIAIALEGVRKRKEWD